MKTKTMYSDDIEMFRDDDIGEAVRNAADDIPSSDPLPQRFTVYEQEFAIVPASRYLHRHYAEYLMEQMDEASCEMIGEMDRSIFPETKVDSEKLNADLKTAIDTVFTKHNIQPTAMVSHGKGKQHLIEWHGPDKWEIIKESID